MKLFALRASDYFRSASREDRRYLLFNPVVKMKVTTEGEKVIDLLWDVIAAKGFEKDTYFEMAARDIRALPKLEGTVHVNIALIVKFMKNYFFAPAPFPPVPRRDDAADDAFLWDQGPAKRPREDPLPRLRRRSSPPGASPTWPSSGSRSPPSGSSSSRATPTEEQAKDVDFLLARRRALHARRLRPARPRERGAPRRRRVDGDIVDQIFDVLVRDFSRHAVDLHGRAGTTRRAGGRLPDDRPEAGGGLRPRRARSGRARSCRSRTRTR